MIGKDGEFEVAITSDEELLRSPTIYVASIKLGGDGTSDRPGSDHERGEFHRVLGRSERMVANVRRQRHAERRGRTDSTR